MNRPRKTMAARRGSILVFSLLILSIMLVTSLTIFSSAVLDRKASISTGSSARSFQVADSGVEEILYQIYKDDHATLSALAGAITGSTCSGSSIGFPSAGGSSVVSFYQDETTPYAGGCSGTDWRDQVVKIKSEGTAGTTTRAVEVAIDGCGGTIEDTRDTPTKVYDTVRIGAQCWMKQNMDVGTVIASSGTPSDNSTIEKYCYGNSAADCSSFGGLYTWDEAMQYLDTSGSRGICPQGFHIPTDGEQYALENFLKASLSASCVPNRSVTTPPQWSCDNAGEKLKSGGLSGFDGLLAGKIDSNTGSFDEKNNTGFFWSSEEAPTGAWRRSIRGSGVDMDKISRIDAAKTQGFSVRCIRDE